MNPDFLRLYEEELYHIREVAQEFARRNTEAAKRLELEPDRLGKCADPFVERLLEGFAFQTARIRLKLDAEYPRFTQGILETVYPDYLAPWPSAAIVRFTPTPGDPALLKNGRIVPRGTVLESRPIIGQTRCIYRTAHELVLHPLRVRTAEYLPGDARHLVSGFEGTPAAVFHIQLEVTDPSSGQEVPRAGGGGNGADKPAKPMLGEGSCERLTFYVDNQRGLRLPSEVLETIFGGATEILVCDQEKKTPVRLGRENLRHAGFTEDEAMLPSNPRGFEGHRVLREYFLLPQRCHFFEINGLGPVFQQARGRELNLFIALDKVNSSLPPTLPEDFLQLFCTPVINLFETTANRVPVVKDLSEYPVVIDRTRAWDHEVYRISGVTGLKRGAVKGRPFHPFYLQPARQEGPAGYYTVRRKQRDLPASGEDDELPGRRDRPITSAEKYRGSDVYISLTNSHAAPASAGVSEFRVQVPVSPEVEELQVQAWCTNRHLPIDLMMGQGAGGIRSAHREHFTARGVEKIRAITLLTDPTPPRPAFVEGRDAWRAVSHLSLNYFSLVGPTATGKTDGAEALRALLRLNVRPPGEQAESLLVDGIRQVSSETDLCRAPGGGQVAFIRGIHIKLTLEDRAYQDRGMFVFASVLEEFFSRHVSINHFTRLTLLTRERGEVMQWPARVGRIPVC